MLQPHLAFLVIVALATLATSAAAQPMETHQTDDVYGEPVPAQSPPPLSPRVAISTDPIGLVAGRYALSGTYVAARQLGVRADITIDEDMPMAPGGGSWRASINVPIYLDRALSGPFVEPGLALANRSTGDDAVGIGVLGGTGTSSGLGGYGYYAQHTQAIEPQIFVGWSLLYRSRLQIAAAIGASRRVSTDGSGASYPVPESYLRVGLAF